MSHLPGSPDRPDPDGACATDGLPAQVERLLRAGVLDRGSRRHRLLDYLVAHHLSTAPGTKLKEYAVAVDVLGRPADFDPASDGIVRVEIARLRKTLDAYFDGPGRNDSLAIRIPRGQYEIEVVPATPGQRPAFGRLGRAASGLVAFAAAGVVALVLALPLLRNVPGGEYPLVRLEPIEDHRPATESVYPAVGISGFLGAELSHFRSFRVFLPDAAGQGVGRQADFRLAGTLEPAEGGSMLNLHLVRGEDESILWASRVTLSEDDMLGAEALHAQLDDLVVRIAGPLGAIDSEGRARLEASRLDWRRGRVSEFQCYLIWQSFDLTKSARERERARDCLDALTAQASGVGQIWAAAAFMRFLDWSEAGPTRSRAAIDAALEAANRAVFLDPTGADGYESLGSILTALGRFDEAGRALARAANLNPSDRVIRVKRGWLDCLTGDWAGGEAEIRAVLADFPVAPGWYRIPLALGAFQRGDAPDFAAEARRIVESGDTRGLVLALAAARLGGDRHAADQAAARLAERGTTVEHALDEIATVFPDAALMAALGETLRPRRSD
ncbi:hypothetical protein [Rhodovulum euryhalinum]|uniref:Uncharacterized protein n=1 Tax=Rhodovulum euryhalinum TaxID=35805 RepID=A0A4R2KJ02_9RHOB|nr:hypothetical protein [Rhodovulum euryhalinum]TCO73871.1 hypothetical protein EV655_10126 [Rhodovulum euryhalinum]